MPELALELTLPQNRVLSGASVPFSLTLTNSGAAPATVKGLGDREGTITLFAETGGTLRKVTQHEMVGLLGAGHVHERNPDSVSLNPGESVETSGDAVRWFGTLEPGTYSLWAAYFGSPTAAAQSLKVTLTVLPATPVALFPCGDGARLGLSPRRFAWLNKAGDEYEIYLTELEARRPTTMLSSKGVDKSPSRVHVYASVENIDPPAATYVLWRSAGPVFRAVRFNQAGAVSSLEVTLPDGSLAPVGSPWSLESGSMAMWCASSTGERAAFVQVDAAGNTRAMSFDPSPVMGPCRASCIDRKEAAHLIWSSMDHAALYAVTVPPLADTPGPCRKIWTTSHRVLHVRLDVMDHEETSADVVVATVLSHDDVNDIFTLSRIVLSDGSQFSKPVEVTQVGSGFLSVIGSTMTREGEVSYLFAKPDKSVLVAPPGLAELRPLTADYANPLTSAMDPFIVAASQLAKDPGVTLIFIRGGAAIERRVLAE